VSASISKLLNRFMDFVSGFSTFELEVALGCLNMGRKTTTTGPSSSVGSKSVKQNLDPPLPLMDHQTSSMQAKVIVHPLMLLTNMNYALAIVSTLLNVTLLLVEELLSPNTWTSTF